MEKKKENLYVSIMLYYNICYALSFELLLFMVL